MNSDRWATIRRLFEVDKLSRADIARKLHSDPKTVRRALAFKEAPPPRVVVVRSSKLDSFKTYLAQRIKEYPDLSAVKLLAELRGMGYPGGVSIIKSHLRVLRPKTPDVFLRIETLPGEQAQVDWANCGTLRVGAALRKLSCFVMVLSYSRMIYLEFTLSQSLEDFLACHVHAFNFFGGIPKKILYDNLKTVVLSRLGRDIRFHPRFMDFAGAYLFEPVPCNVRAGWEKGKVESGIRYIRISFLTGRPITSWPLLARDADHWRDTVANVRNHGTTAEKPIDRFPADKAALRSLPARDYDTSIVRPVKATRQAFILFDVNAYSVPAALTGKPLTLKADPHHVRVFNGQDLVAEHPRSYEKEPRHRTPRTPSGNPGHQTQGNRLQNLRRVPRPRSRGQGLSRRPRFRRTPPCPSPRQNHGHGCPLRKNRTPSGTDPRPRPQSLWRSLHPEYRLTTTRAPRTPGHPASRYPQQTSMDQNHRRRAGSFTLRRPFPRRTP
ncbi:MAG: IS21 family transposase [Elusimicrobia bacterium]|nr:IS21 family transposase [Elusimicrobiota bacterium]